MIWLKGCSRFGGDGGGVPRRDLVQGGRWCRRKTHGETDSRHRNVCQRVGTCVDGVDHVKQDAIQFLPCVFGVHTQCRVFKIVQNRTSEKAVMKIFL